MLKSLIERSFGFGESAVEERKHYYSRDSISSQVVGKPKVGLTFSHQQCHPGFRAQLHADTLQRLFSSLETVCRKLLVLIRRAGVWRYYILLCGTQRSEAL